MDARRSHEKCCAEGDQKDRQQDHRERTHCARFASLPKVEYGYRKQFRAVAVKEDHRTEGAHESDEKNQRAGEKYRRHQLERDRAKGANPSRAMHPRTSFQLIADLRETSVRSE